jgi:hypothetical protein
MMSDTQPSCLYRPGRQPLLRSAFVLVLVVHNAMALAQAATTPLDPGQPAASATAVLKPPVTSGLAEMAAQLEKSSDVVVVEVSGVPITAGMAGVARRAMPETGDRK